jgi:hypothetical protein
VPRYLVRPGIQSRTSSNLSFHHLRTIPAANRIAKQSVLDIASSWPRISQQLTEDIGFGFPILCKLRRIRAVRAIAAALITHLGSHRSNISRISPVAKWLMGFVYATCVNQRRMTFDFLSVISTGLHRQTSAYATIRAVEDFALWHLDFTGRGEDAFAPALAVLSNTSLSDREKMLLALAKSSSGNSSVMAGSVVSGLHLCVSRCDIAEACSWISLLEMLHRLYCFYEPNEDSLLSQRIPSLVMGEEKSLARLAHALPNLDGGMTAAAKLYDCTLTASGRTRQHASGGPYERNLQIAGPRKGKGKWWQKRSASKPVLDIGPEDLPKPTIYTMLETHRLPIAEVFMTYGECTLRAGHALMGSAFNIQTILSIWPTAMRTYLQLLQSPGRLSTVDARQSCALAAFFSSRSAKSRYAAMHTALAARVQGLPEDLLNATAFSDRQAACISVALKLSSVPGSSITKEARDCITEHFSDEDVEKIVCTSEKTVPNVPTQ